MQRSATINSVLACALFLTLGTSVFSIAGMPSILKASYASHENISFEISDTEFEHNDDVTITGSIDDPVSGDDEVTIKVYEPGGSVDEEDDVNLDDNDEFDFIYSVTTSADDGVYKVEVEYDGDKVFGFFIVDEDNDTVSVSLDSDTYGGGDEIEISGQVDEIVTGEDEVEITIIDVNDDEILEEEGVTLGEGSGVDDDEFTFTFDDLDSDADHGQYAVIVTYDGGDQEGSAIFTVEDDGSGSGGSDNISADLNKDAYKPGETVTLTGNIDVTDNSLELEIVVEDPSNDEIESDDDVTVESDGDFEFEFDLEDDANEGEYTITMTYGDDEREITFDVDEDAGSGSGTSGLTVRLDKSSYLAGQTIIVTGTVPKIVSDEEVSVLVYNKDSVFMGSADYVEPKSDKTYSASLRLKVDLEVEEDYEVRVNYNGEEATTQFSITGQLSGSDVISIKTDKTEYEAGSTVEITGKIASDALVDGTRLLLQVYNPEDAAYRIDQVDVEDDGSFSYSMAVGGKLGISGLYEIKASYNGKEAKTTFEITGGKPVYSLKAAGQTFRIEYDISAGTLKSMFVNEDEKKLVVVIDAIEDGELTLVLPRQVIDSAQNGNDIPYLVATTDLEAGSGGDVEIDEDDSSSSARTLTISYKKGTDLVEISGTSVVPEFGPLSAIVLAVALVAVIVAATRFAKFKGYNNRSARTGLF